MKNLGRFYNLTNGGQAEGAGTSSGIVEQSQRISNSCCIRSYI